MLMYTIDRQWLYERYFNPKHKENGSLWNKVGSSRWEITKSMPKNYYPFDKTINEFNSRRLILMKLTHKNNSLQPIFLICTNDF